MRLNTFEAGLAPQASESGHGPSQFFNNYNARFEELYARAQASDVVLITGDIVDYGRGHDGAGKLGDIESYLLDRNWFVFYTLLAGRGRYTRPVYTVLGNHDWRQDPYGPICSQFNQALDLQLTSKELAGLHGPGAAALIYGSTTNTTLANRKAEWSPLLTSLDSVKWYLLLINPFLDYVVRHPGGFCLTMLDWAKEETVITLSSKKDRWAKPGAFLASIKVGLPVAQDSLTGLQKRLVEWFLQLPEGAKAVGLHAALVSPEESIGDDALRMGCLVPCPICNGTGHFNEKKFDDGIRYVDRACSCRPPSGPAPSWLPYRAVNIALHEETDVPDEHMAVRGTLSKHRDWLIGELIRHKVAAVFSGHTHRNTLLRITDDFDWNHPLLPGGCAVMVESLPLTGNARPPVFVNTSSAGPVGWRIPLKDVYIPERPGIAIVRLRFDGAVVSARYEVSTILKLRAKRLVDKEKKVYEFCDEEYQEPPGLLTSRDLAPSKT